LDVGNAIPKLFAVLRLITSANFVGNSAGNSAGLAPRSTLAGHQGRTLTKAVYWIDAIGHQPARSRELWKQ
jgi:hypothetical protein